MDQPAIFLSRRLKEYIDSRHDGNVNRACFHLDIKDYNSVYRIYHAKANSVHFFLAYRILSQTDPSNFCEILADLYPEEMTNISKIRSASEADAIGDIAKKFALAVSSETHFSIYARALEHDGLMLDDIASDFGKKGLQVASDLLNAGVLFIDNGTLRSDFADKDIRPSMSSVKQHAHLHLDLAQDTAPGFRIENPFGGVNSDGVAKIFTILDKAAAEILSVFRNPEFEGDVMYLVSILGGRMSAPSDKEQGQ